MKKLLILPLVLSLVLPAFAFAQGISQLQQFTSTTSPSSAITQTVFGKAFRLTGQSSGCAQFSANGTLSSTGTNCGSGGGGTFPFTPQSYGNSTSTTLGFLNGLFSNGSTTISSLGSGIVGANNGLLYGAATSTLTPSSPLTGSFTQLGSGGSLGCQTASGSQAGCLSSANWTTFNNKAGFGYLFPVGGYGTTTGLGIFGSSTIGDGTQAGGLTISGNATTTGVALMTNLFVTGSSTLPYLQPVAPFEVVGGNTDGATVTGTAGLAEFGGYVDTPFISAGLTQNYLVRSETLDTAATWVSSVGVIVANGLNAPNDAVIAERIQPGTVATDGINQTIQNSLTGNVNFSVWLKSRVTPTATTTLEVDFGNGTATTTGTGCIVNLSQEWKRYNCTQMLSGGPTRITVLIENGTADIGAWGTQLSNTSNTIAYVGNTSTNQSLFIPATRISSNLTAAGSLNAGTGVSVGGALTNASTGAFSGLVTASQYRVSGGNSAGSPAYASTGDTATGLFLSTSGAHIIGFTSNGVEVARIASGGNTGIGSSSPYAKLSVHANNGDTNTTLFAIASSTASATTTLFSVSNTGVASTTSLFGAMLSSCAGASNALTWSNGTFGCNTITSSGASTTLLADTNTWSGNNVFSNTITGSISGNAASVTTNANLTGVVTSVGNTTSFGSQSAGVLGSPVTGNTSVQATSTLYGAVQLGKILGYANGVLQPIATTTFSCSSGITCSFAGGAESYSIGSNALTLSMFPTIGANTIIGNLTGSTATPTAFATSSLFTGLTGQFDYYSGAGALVGTSDIFDSSALIGVGSTTPFSRLSIGTGAASSSITVAEYKYGKGSNVATSTTANIDCNASTQIAWPLGGSATTLTLINLTPGKKCVVVVQNPNGTAGAITWAVQSNAILKWTGGTAPTQTTTANTMDVWSFLATAGSSTMEIIGAATLNN